MSQTLSAEFDTRRDAEMAIEHIVQEYGLDRAVVTIVAVSQDNSAGTRVSGSDLENGDDEIAATTRNPAIAGRLKVSAEVDESSSARVRASFATYGGKLVD